MKNFALENHKISKYYLLAVLVFLILLKLIDLTVAYYNLDEITNALYARLLISGELKPESFLGNTYIFTHYWYALVYYFFPRDDLQVIYVVYTFWGVLTAIAFKYAGDQLTQIKNGGWITSLFYVATSLSFMSKDYRAAISEGLSLLPLTLACYFYFSFLNKPQKNALIAGFLTGSLIGIGALFKAPAGVAIFALWFSLLFIQERKMKLFLSSLLGLVVALTLPLMLFVPFKEAIGMMFNKLNETNQYYIGAYEALPILYWGIKCLTRTSFILAATPIVTYLIFKTFQMEFVKSAGVRLKQREMILFLIFWLFTSWLTVSLGKRIFYHYFIFLIPALCLLATPYAIKWWLAHRDKPKHVALAVLLLVIPPLGFSLEAYQGWSQKRHLVPEVVDYIKTKTQANDRIYVWGMVPQLYFYSNRLPATTHFWSESLVGTTPGSSAMEDLRINKDSSLTNMFVQDLRPTLEKLTEALPFNPNDIMRNPVTDFDLLNNTEVLDLLSSPQWVQVFKDFEAHPPVLFIDSTATGIRNFSAYPLEKFPLWRRFIRDNYTLEAVVRNFVIYRLKN